MKISTARFFLLTLAFGITALSSGQSQNYGIDAPQPIGPYLDGVFPSETPGPSGAWQVVDAFPNLTFIDPVRLIHRAEMDRFYVVGKSGHIWFFNDSAATSSKTLFLDLSQQTRVAGDSGLLGMVFHPEFGVQGSPNRHYVYVYYRYTPDKSLTSGGSAVPAYMRLSRFSVSPVTQTADPASELVLINQFDRHDWHQGGGMFFGPEGFLYLTVGDEGAAHDSYRSAQKLNGGLFSGILRLDVDMDPQRSHPIRRQPLPGGTPPSGWPATFTANYFVPNDNPWQDAGGGVLEEFYAVGLRSPHAMSFDPDTGDIWIGDVGQGSREEVSVARKGDNLQWPYREGNVNGQWAQPSPLIGRDTPPVWSYPRSDGGCVIGGYVYRGQKFAGSLFGKYLVGDHNSRTLWTVTRRAGQAPLVEYLASMPGQNGGKAQLAGWGTDDEGNVFMCKPNGTGNGNGKIYKLARSGTAVPEPPATLSQTGAFSDLNHLTARQGLLPYTVNAPLFSDNAAKKRWIAVPNDGSHNTAAEKINIAADGTWEFPPGSVIVKHFELPIDESNPSLVSRLETRFLVHTANGGMYGVTYRWRADGSDADLLPAGDTRDLTVQLAGGGTRDQRWHFPSRADCLSCHNDNAGRMLGLKNHQLNGDFFYLLTGRNDNQLRALNHIGLFTPALSESAIGTMQKAAALTDSHASLEHRVRSYADSNCAQCHQPNGVAADFDARFTTALAGQNIVRGELEGAYAPADAALVQPGDLDRSIFHRRDISTGDDRMPPMGRTLVDETYRQVLEAWIGSMPLDYTVAPDAGLSAPVAIDDAATVDQGGSVSIAVLNNDRDDADALYPGAISIVNPPAAGSVNLDSASGALVYVHDGDTATSDSFTYAISDPHGNVSSPATVTLSISPHDTGSDAIADYPFTANFNDVSGNGLHLTASGSPSLITQQGREVVRFQQVGDRLSVDIPDALLMPAGGQPLSLEVLMRARAYPAYGSANAPIVQLEQGWDTSIAIGQEFWDEAPHIRTGSLWLLDPEGWQNNVPLNVWRTVRVDFDGNQTFSLSIDGQPVTSAQWQPGVGHSLDWRLVVGNFDGDIDSITISGNDIAPPTDTIPPSVNLTAPTSSTTSPIPLAIAFSETVTGLSAGDFVVSNGSIGSLAGGGEHFSASVTPITAGPVTIQLPADVVSDAAGNGSLVSNVAQINYQPPGGGGGGGFDFGVNLNTHLAAPYQAGGMALSSGATGADLSYTREVGADRIETLEASADLVQWIDLGSPSIVSNGDGTETVTFAGIENISPLTPALGFVRLRVESTNPTVTTRTLPLGWYRVSLSGTQSHGLSVIRETLWSGTVSGLLNSNDVSVAPELPNAVTGALYLEILDGTLAGHRFDLSLTGVTANQVRLDLTSANNTRSAIDSSLIDARVAIRRHWTLADAFPAGVMTGGPTAASADRIKVYDSSSSTYTTYYLHQGIKWVLDGDESLVDQGGTVLPPGEGVFVTRGSGAVLNLTHRGEVRANPFVQPLLPGSTFLAEPFPLSLSPGQRQLTSSEVFIGSSDPDGADGVQLWNGTSYDRYYLWENWPTAYWRRLGSTVNQNNTKLFDFRRGTFITTLWGYHPNYTVPVPWLP